MPRRNHNAPITVPADVLEPALHTFLPISCSNICPFVVRDRDAPEDAGCPDIRIHRSGSRCINRKSIADIAHMILNVVAERSLAASCGLRTRGCQHLQRRTAALTHHWHRRRAQLTLWQTMTSWSCRCAVEQVPQGDVASARGPPQPVAPHHLDPRDSERQGLACQPIPRRPRAPRASWTT
jgi:hypothetical protein